MAYRFATVLGLAGLLAQNVVALPMADTVVTQIAYTTVTAGATQPTAAPAAAPAPAAPSAVKQAPAQGAQGQAPAPVAQAPNKPKPSSSAPAPSASASSTGTSPNKGGMPGRGVCVDGTLGSTGTSMAKSIIDANPGKLNWYTNWGTTGEDIGSTKFYPMLQAPGAAWSPKGDVAIAFNEADLKMGSADSVCSSYKSAYLPAVKAAGSKSTTPSFTSRDCSQTNDPSMGLCWFKAFWEKCGGDDIDYANTHYYFNAVDAGKKPEDFVPGSDEFKYFTNLVEQTHQISGKPVMITEVGLESDKPQAWTEAQHATFLATAETWLSQQSYVAGWGAYQVGNKVGNLNMDAGAPVVAKYLSA